MAEIAHDLQSQIRFAVRSRIDQFKEQASYLTLEEFRRLLEKDLGLGTYELDVHKIFVKQFLRECLDGVNDDNASKSSGESPENLQLKKDGKKHEIKWEDSSILNILTGDKQTETRHEETHSNKTIEVSRKSMINKSRKKRASYVDANSSSATLDPGPLDTSVLYLQHCHRSTCTWNTQDSTLMACRRRMAVLHRQIPMHSRMIPLLLQSGFYGMARLGFISLDWHLITAFVERWRQETHTFHLPHGECTITLQDVAILLGLPVDGLPVTGSSDRDWAGDVERLLGVRPSGSVINGSRLKLTWLAKNFRKLPDDAGEEHLHQYTRAYILQLMGGSLFCDKSGCFVHLMFLPFLEDFQSAGRYSWGSACLAWLYRELCRATHAYALEIAGPLILLQLWAWDRFPFIAPTRLQTPSLVDKCFVGQPCGPLAMRWRDNFSVTRVSTHVISSYRSSLDQQRPEQMIWQPYTSDILAALPEYCLEGQKIWRSVVPLICFHLIEWHRPDRVLPQFGIVQDVPGTCDTNPGLHEIDLRGRFDIDWASHHAIYIVMWHGRHDCIATGQAITHTHSTSRYMEWYRRITRRYHSRIGAFHGILGESLSQIQALTTPGASPYQIARAHGITSTLLSALHEHIQPDSLSASGFHQVTPPSRGNKRRKRVSDNEQPTQLTIVSPNPSQPTPVAPFSDSISLMPAASSHSHPIDVTQEVFPTLKCASKRGENEGAVKREWEGEDHAEIKRPHNRKN